MSKLTVRQLAGNLDNLVKNFKTIVNPSSMIPDESADEITRTMHALSTLLEGVVATHAEQAKALDSIHIGLTRLFQQLEAIKPAKVETQKKEATSDAPTSSKEEVKKESASPDLQGAKETKK